MILEVPSAWKAVASNGAVTVLILAQERLLSMSVHSMSFTFVSEQARSGRKRNSQTGAYFATVGLEMGIQVFTTMSIVSVFRLASRSHSSLIIALQLLGLMCASVPSGEGTVVEPVISRLDLV